MKVLGISTSHEASICQMTDGKIDWFHEEARWRRDKWFIPMCIFPGDPFNDAKEVEDSLNWKSIDWVNET